MAKQSKPTLRRISNSSVQYPIPQKQSEAVDAIEKIDQHQRERDRIQAEMNDKLAELKRHFEDQAAPDSDVIKQLGDGVQIWTEANRVQLNRGDSVKTVHLASGEISWRFNPPKCSVFDISIIQGEQFVIRPFETELEEAA